MLRRQLLWVPTVKHNPAFVEGFHRFLRNNPVTSMNAAALAMKPEDSFVALEPDPRHPDRQVAAMLAFPVTILSPACDGKYLSAGFATAVCDSTNSFHVMERLLPAFNMHVSVNIQSQQIRQLEVGEKVVVISSIDKMGKRLVYCKTEFVVDAAEVPPEVAQAESQVKTVADLMRALAYYERAFSGTHVKSILAEPKTI